MIRKILVGLLLIVSANLLAQRTSSSPYSSFGFGETFNSNTVEQASMGGVGAAYSNYRFLNFTNPAANAALKFTTFSLGLTNRNLTLKTTGFEEKVNSTIFNYLAVAFPLGKKAAFTIGLQPLTTVGYSFVNREVNFEGTEVGTTRFLGSGGINKFYGAFGVQLTKELSVGAQIESNFGNIRKQINSQQPNELSTVNTEDLDFRAVAFTIGTQYSKKIKKDLLLTAGASSKLGYDLNVSGADVILSQGTGSLSRDVALDKTVSGKYELPIKSTFGVGIGKFQKWYVGAEYEFQDAIKSSGNINANAIDENAANNGIYKFGDLNRISLGGFIIPKISSITNYWKRVAYRAGIRMEKTGLLIDQSQTNRNFTSIDDFGISFGLGLPLKGLSTLNLGFEYGKKGTTDNNLIEENYFNFRIGLSLSDKNWFVKRKID